MPEEKTVWFLNQGTGVAWETDKGSAVYNRLMEDKTYVVVSEKEALAASQPKPEKEEQSPKAEEEQPPAESLTLVPEGEEGQEDASTTSKKVGAKK
jgi:hypothetical protein